MWNYYFSTSVVDFLFLSKIMFQKWKYKHVCNYGVYVLLEYKSLEKGGQAIWSEERKPRFVDWLIALYIRHIWMLSYLLPYSVLRIVLRNRGHYCSDTLLKVEVSKDRSILVRVTAVEWWRRNSNPSLCDCKSHIFLTLLALEFRTSKKNVVL